MAENRELRDSAHDVRDVPPSVSEDVEYAITNAAGDISDEVRDLLFAKLASRGEEGLVAAHFGEGILLAALRLIGPDGTYAIDEGRFWQLMDRHCPFSPLKVDEQVRLRLESEIDELLGAAEGEVFEDGFDSIVSLELQRLLLKHGNLIVEIVADRVLGHRVSADVAAEVFCCFGEVENAATSDARRRLLERGLACESHYARDGAVIGLSDIANAQSVPALEQAAAVEKHEGLKSNMNRLLARLKERGP